MKSISTQMKKHRHGNITSMKHNTLILSKNINKLISQGFSQTTNIQTLLVDWSETSTSPTPWSQNKESEHSIFPALLPRFVSRAVSPAPRVRLRRLRLWKCVSVIRVGVMAAAFVISRHAKQSGWNQVHRSEHWVVYYWLDCIVCWRRQNVIYCILLLLMVIAHICFILGTKSTPEWSKCVR